MQNKLDNNQWLRLNSSLVFYSFTILKSASILLVFSPNGMEIQ